MAELFGGLALPIVCGSHEKESFRANIGFPIEAKAAKIELMRRTALMDCLMQAEWTLAKFPPHEIPMVVPGDGVPHKELTKQTVRMMRGRQIISELGEPLRNELGLPMRRIVDAVHFAAEVDARTLQTADLCTFMIDRFLKGTTIPHRAMSVFGLLINWRADMLLLA